MSALPERQYPAAELGAWPTLKSALPGRGILQPCSQEALIQEGKTQGKAMLELSRKAGVRGDAAARWAAFPGERLGTGWKCVRWLLAGALPRCWGPWQHQRPRRMAGGAGAAYVPVMPLAGLCR